MRTTSKPGACPACGLDRQEISDLLNEAVSALELCLGCPNLTWEAEQEAEIVCRKLKRGFSSPS